MLVSQLKDRCSPMYFLAALGAGGLAVSFFLYPMFLVPHPDTPMVTLDHLRPVLTGGNTLHAVLLALALAAVAALAVAHYALLVWNLRKFKAFRQTEAYQQLFSSNAEISLMAVPLTLAMIAVGLAAPGAMGHHREINAIAMLLSIFFASAAVLLLVVLVLGFDAILRHGIQPQAAGSLWILIPILTLLGITWIRWSNGLSHQFGNAYHPTDLFVFAGWVLSLQVLFGLIGYAVMNKLSYFADCAVGPKTNAGAFALICPGVAFFVFGLFFLTFGLVKTGLVEQASLVYFLLLTPLAFIQLKTVQVWLQLAGKLLLEPRSALAAA